MENYIRHIKIHIFVLSCINLHGLKKYMKRACQFFVTIFVTNKRFTILVKLYILIFYTLLKVPRYLRKHDPKKS